MLMVSCTTLTYFLSWLGSMHAEPHGVVDMSMIIRQIYIGGLVVLEKCVDLLQNKDHHNQKVTEHRCK